MTTNSKNGHAAAYARWFDQYEVERKRRHIAPGRNVPGVPGAPPGPNEVRRVIFEGINPIGDRRAADLCNVHRTTIGRWLDGSVQIPSSAYSLLLFHADGVPPGCGEAWRGFQWLPDALICPDGKTLVTARQIEGWQYQVANVSALERKCADLERMVVEMARRIDWGSANDPYQSPTDPRAKAFR